MPSSSAEGSIVDAGSILYNTSSPEASISVAV